MVNCITAAKVHFFLLFLRSRFTLCLKVFHSQCHYTNKFISIQRMNLLGQNRDKNIYLKCTNNRSYRNHQRNVIRNGKCIHQYKELAIHLKWDFFSSLLCETSRTTWLNIHNSIEFTFFYFCTRKKKTRKDSLSVEIMFIVS